MMERVHVILPAGGQSTRFGGARNKLLETLCGQTILARTLKAFLYRGDVGGVILATHLPESEWSSGDPALLEHLRARRLQTCPGGDSRAASVRNALRLVPVNVPWVAVHDAARPLVSSELIDRVFVAAHCHGAAAPALPVASTVKQASGPLPARVEKTVPRHTLWAMQTPQVMRRERLEEALLNCPIPLDQITDDAQALELTGDEVWLVDGKERNIKITTRLDLLVATAIVKAERHESGESR